MSRLIHLGFDVSTTGAGAVLLDDQANVLASWVWQNDSDHVDERVYLVGLWAAEVFYDITIGRVRCSGNDILSCSIESPFFRGSGSRMLAEAQGAIKAQHRAQWGNYAAQTVKATASSLAGIKTSGDGDKDAMTRAAEIVVGFDQVEKWDDLAMTQPDRTKALGDIVDAYFVARTDLLAARATTKEN